MIKKVILILLAIVFGLFAYWQLNDSDPQLWVPIYGGVALILALKAFIKLPKIVTLLASVALVVGVGLYIPGAVEWYNEGMPSITGQMKAASPYIENMREGLGLLIAALAMVFAPNS
ncbi:MAG: transmembrane 220 family protein [Bacteroidota bacterium]